MNRALVNFDLGFCLTVVSVFPSLTLSRTEKETCVCGLLNHYCLGSLGCGDYHAAAIK